MIYTDLRKVLGGFKPFSLTWEEINGIQPLNRLKYWQAKPINNKKQLMNEVPPIELNLR